MKHPGLALRISTARAARHLRREELAAMASLSPAILQKLEYGSSNNPRLATLRSIAKALRIPLTALLPPDDWTYQPTRKMGDSPMLHNADEHRDEPQPVSSGYSDDDDEVLTGRRNHYISRAAK